MHGGKLEETKLAVEDNKVDAAVGGGSPYRKMMSEDKGSPSTAAASAGNFAAAQLRHQGQAADYLCSILPRPARRAEMGVQLPAAA